jgi:hypothetical protein
VAVARGRGWWRRWLHNATGDRVREAAVLAEAVVDDRAASVGVPEGRVLETAKEAVAVAHGDGDPKLDATSESEIATPADVARVATDHVDIPSDERPNDQTNNQRSKP